MLVSKCRCSVEATQSKRLVTLESLVPESVEMPAPEVMMKIPWLLRTVRMRHTAHKGSQNYCCHNISPKLRCFSTRKDTKAYEKEAAATNSEICLKNVRCTKLGNNVSMAQLVERRIHNPKVTGSIPVGGTRRFCYFFVGGQALGWLRGLPSLPRTPP